VDGDLVILDRTRGYVHQLNATASHIWSACDGRHSVDEIAATLEASFNDAPQDLRDAVVNTLSDFDKLGLLISPSLSDDAASEET
jgi:PqqD family protein of HPr-rel-A system